MAEEKPPIPALSSAREARGVHLGLHAKGVARRAVLKYNLFFPVPLHVPLCVVLCA